VEQLKKSDLTNDDIAELFRFSADEIGPAKSSGPG
jgi:hypothetical protein